MNSTIDPAHKIRYCALDYSHISKHRNLDVSASLNEVSTWAVNQTGFFCSSPRWKIAEGGVVEPFTEADGRGAERLSQRLGVPVFPMEQNGVLRTNCIEYVAWCRAMIPFAAGNDRSNHSNHDTAVSIERTSPSLARAWRPLASSLLSWESGPRRGSIRRPTLFVS